MQTILNIVKTGLKGDNDIEIEVPLYGNPKTNKLQSNISRISLNKVSSQNATPNTEIISDQTNAFEEKQYSGQTVLQPINILKEMAKATDELKTINKYNSEIEKRSKSFSKQNDEQEMIAKRNQLSFLQPTPISDDVIIPNRFPLHVLPEPFQHLLKSQAHALNVPVEAVAPALIGAIFISGRGSFKIQVKRDYYEAFTEYIFAVMPSGSKKSAIVHSFRSVFDKYIADLQAVFDDNLPNQKLIVESCKKTKQKILKDLMKDIDAENLSSINDQLKRVADTLAPVEKEMEKLTRRPCFFNDSPTLKKLAKNMKPQNETLAIFEAEAGIWKDRVKSNEDTILLKAYTMEPFGNETSTNGSVIMDFPVLTICSYMQPDTAAKIYSKEDLKDDGLLPRILPVFIHRNKDIQDMDPLDVHPELIELYEAKIKSILKFTLTGNTDANKRQINTLKLKDEAYTIYADFTRKINQQLNDGKFKNCEAFGAKLAGHAIRLAGAVHFLQHEEPWEELISSSAIEAGIAIAEFFAAHAKSVFDSDRFESIKYANKILKKIKEKRIGLMFSQRDAQRAVGHCMAPQISAGLDLLENNNFLSSHTDLTNKTTFIVNPRIINGNLNNLTR